MPVKLETRLVLELEGGRRLVASPEGTKLKLEITEFAREGGHPERSTSCVASWEEAEKFFDALFRVPRSYETLAVPSRRLMPKGGDKDPR